MLEFLNSLSWPGAFAVVASIVTSVTGLFGYLVSVKRREAAQKRLVTPEFDYEKLHSRINDAIERIAENEGDLKEARASIRSLQKACSSHEQRDIEDFKLVDAKIDRLMDIVVRMLQDDKL